MRDVRAFGYQNIVEKLAEKRPKRTSQMRISEGQTAVIAYPFAFSGCKSTAIVYEFKRFVPESFESEGDLAGQPKNISKDPLFT